MRKHTVKIMAFLLAAVLTAALMPFSALAASNSGTCGTNARWTMDEATGTLTVTGSGAITKSRDYYAWEIKKIVIDEGITSIGDYAFGGEYFFYGYLRDLASVTLPSTLKEIGEGAFCNAINLTEIDLPEGLTTIGSSAFYDTSIESIYIPSKVSSIGYYALDIPSLKTVSVSNNNPYFKVIDNVLYNTTSASSWSIVCYPRGNTMTDFTIPSQVTEIPSGTFYENEYLTSVTVPSGVKEIGDETFARCYQLERINLPDGLTTFELSSISACSSLKRLDIPASVKNITFSGVTGFGANNTVTEIYFYGAKAPAFDSLENLSDSKTHYDNGKDYGKFIFYYPEQATGWDEVISEQQEVIAGSEGTIEFKSWKPDNMPEVKEEYTVSYELNGGTGTKPEDVSYEEGAAVVVTDVVPTRKGYKFDGWSDGTNTYKAGESFTMPAHDVELTAVWKSDGQSPFSGEPLHPENWYSYNEEFGEKHITTQAQLDALIRKFSAETDATTAARLTAVLKQSSYRPLIGNINWPYRNLERQGCRVTDNGLGTTVDWGKTNQGCISYSFFVSQYVHGTTGSAIDLGGTKPTADELKAFIERWATAGEHIRFFRNGGLKVHSIVFLTADENGFYFLSYPSNNAVDVLYCTYAKFVDCLRVTYDSGRYRTLFIYNVDKENTVSPKTITLSTKGQAIVSVGYNGEVLSNNGARSTMTASFGTVQYSGSGEDQTAEFVLDYHRDYDIRLTGTGVGKVDLAITYNDQTSAVISRRDFQSVPVTARTTITTSAVDYREAVCLYVDENSDSVFDSCWSAEVDTTATGPSDDALFQIYSGEPESASAPAVTVSPVTHGTVTADIADPKPGDTVTLTVVPEDGYVLKSLTVTDGDGYNVTLTGSGDGKYTFVMPNGTVTIAARFGRSDMPFTDVYPDDWFYDEVWQVWDKELMTGKTTTTFAPSDTATRAEVATILWRMDDCMQVNLLLQYSDVEEDVWYTEAVRWATGTEVVKGYGDGRFGTGDTITREQFAVMLYRFAEYLDMDTTVTGTPLTAFPDAGNVSEWAGAAVAWAVDRGIINGADGRLAPQGSAQRAQLAAMIRRFADLQK